MSGNVSGNAYALTVLSPIRDGYTQDEIAYADLVRDRLDGVPDAGFQDLTGAEITSRCSGRGRRCG